MFSINIHQNLPSILLTMVLDG